MTKANKEKLHKESRDCYRKLFEDGKGEKKDYGINRNKNMTDDNRKRIKRTSEKLL